MKYARLLLLTLCLCGCSPNFQTDAAPQAMNTVSLNPEDWYFYYAQQLGANPEASAQGAWSFQLPSQPGLVAYLKTPFQTTTIPASISLTFEMVSDDPEYNGAVDPTDTNPAHFHLFFERKGDESLTNPAYRWWCGQGGYQLGSNDNQTLTITCPLTYDHWTDVYGATDPNLFQDALQNVAWVGLTFGGNNYYGHGVNMTAGQAQFILKNYQVNY